MSKIFIKEFFSVSLNSGIKKIYALEGYVTIFRRKFFVSQNRKNLHGNLSVLCFGKFPVSHKLIEEKRGSIKFLRRVFLSHTVENCRRGTLESFINFGCGKSSDERLGGVSRFSVENVLSHSAKNLRR